MFGWGPGGTFGEVPEEVKEMFDRQQMQQEDVVHGVKRLITELNKDQLVSLRHLLRACAGGDDSVSSYYQGIISAHLELRYEVCPGCGEDHEQNMLDEMGTPDKVELAPTPPDDVKRSTEIDGQLELDLETVTENKIDEEGGPLEQLMKYYGLNASLNQPGYECEHCKMFFRSIKDRTSLDRDACPGCQHRSAWG